MRLNDTGSAWTAKDYGIAALVGLFVVLALLAFGYLCARVQVWSIVYLAKSWGYL